MDATQWIILIGGVFIVVLVPVLITRRKGRKQNLTSTAYRALPAECAPESGGLGQEARGGALQLKRRDVGRSQVGYGSSRDGPHSYVVRRRFAVTRSACPLMCR